jgi:hypothetical protein
MKKDFYIIFSSILLWACNGKTYYCNCTYTDTTSLKEVHKETHTQECISKSEAIKSCNKEKDRLVNSGSVLKENEAYPDCVLE